MLGPRQHQKMVHMFHVHDQDRDGAVERSDYVRIAENFARSRGWVQGSPEYEALLGSYLALWSSVGKHASDPAREAVNLEEWLASAEELLGSMQAYRATIEAVADGVFRLLDADGDGIITLREFQQFFQAYQLDARNAEDSFRHVDTDQDGFLRRDEVFRAVEEYHLSEDPEAPGNWLFGPV